MGKRILSFLLVITILGALLPAIGTAEVPVGKVPASRNSKNWMGYLPNDVNLTEINIPGTHDSGTRYIMTMECLEVLQPIIGIIATFALPLATVLEIDLLPAMIRLGELSLAPLAQDQSLTIPEQFEAGYRIIDCRLSAYNGLSGNYDDLEFSHGGIRCLESEPNYLGDGSKPLKLTKVMQYAKDFLKQNPTETIILGVTNENFMIPPIGSDDSLLSLLYKELGAIKIGEAVFNDFGHVGKINTEDLFNIGPNAKKLLYGSKEDGIVGYLDYLKDDPDVIVMDDEKWPTMGEARGKVIICDGDKYLQAGEYTIGGETWNVGSWTHDAATKWYNLNGYFDACGKYDDQYYAMRTYPSPMHFVAANCTDTNGMYFLNGILILLSKAMLSVELGGYISDLCSVFGWVDHGLNDYRSAAEWQSADINPKLQSYSYKKGTRYGWIAMDFGDENIAKKIFDTNVFDFDVAGDPVDYITEIVIAYDQSFEKAKKTLTKAGYTVLNVNMNEEGPDKGLSDAIVNGVRNNGSFNMALGYKTSQDPKYAITDLKWTQREWEGIPLDKSTKEFLDKYHYQLVNTRLTEVINSGLKTSEGLASFNIGTSGRMVNLYCSRDGSCGERLTTLKAVQGYDITAYDPKDKPYNPRTILNAEKTIRSYFALGMDTPREAGTSSLPFMANYRRTNINNAFVFYNTVFNDASQWKYYLPLYQGDDVFSKMSMPWKGQEGDLPDTGDTNPIIGWFILLVSSFAGALVCLRNKRKDEKPYK